ncbi:hypothetical protein ACROYT_G013546 [Oculina patagonica]
MDNGRPVQLPVTPDIQTQAPPGQPVQPGQRVYDQSTPGHQEQPQAGQGFDLTIDTDFLKSPLYNIKIAEFVVLICAWASTVKYLDDFHQNFLYYEIDDKEASFFKFVTIFCWVMVILCLIIYTFSVSTFCKWKRSSEFTVMCLIFSFIIFALLLACTGKLVFRTAFLENWLQKYIKANQNKSSRSLDEVINLVRPLIVSLGVASAFGFLSCIMFVVDMVLSYKLFQTQRAHETSPDHGSIQRRALYINKDYIRSPVFYVKLAEIVFLFVAWVCIIKYFADITVSTPYSPLFFLRQPEDSKVDLFKGVTILSWVMVVLISLTSVLSFDKLCSRSSPWTLTTVIIYFILSILLIASCGNLTPRAVELKKREKSLSNIHDDEFGFDGKWTFKPSIIALQIGLAFGFLCCIVFVVDMVLSFQVVSDAASAGDIPRPWTSPETSRRCQHQIPAIPDVLCEIGRNYSKAILFREIIIFSWAMVILLALTSVFSFDKLFRRAPCWSLMTLIIYFILLILLSACCGNLTPRAVEWGESYKRSVETDKPFKLALLLGLAFGFVSCLLFVVDVVLNYKLYLTQRAQETSPDQGPPQRQAENMNTNYLRSSVFYVKLAEIVLLFVAWVCIVNYFDFALLYNMRGYLYKVTKPDKIHKDLKADFFQGVTVLCWVMVNILALTFLLRLDKLYSRSSRCTLTTLIIYFVLLILLFACCGYLTPRALAIDLGKEYKNSTKKDYENWPAVALRIGLAFGYLSSLIFILDICLLCMLYRKQRAEEVHHPQQADEPPYTELRQPAPDQAPDTQLRQPAVVASNV